MAKMSRRHVVCRRCPLQWAGVQTLHRRHQVLQPSLVVTAEALEASGVVCGGIGLLVLDLLGVACCYDSTSYVGSFLSVGPSCSCRWVLTYLVADVL